MAEEKFDESQTDGLDDMSVLNTLLRTVRGISVVSSAPLLDLATATDDVEFDQ